MPTIADVARHLDRLLGSDGFPDYPAALNGLQVYAEGEVARVALAVDARERTIRGAADADANLLIVHHGLFWGGLQPLRGPHLRRVRALLDARITLYSAHLPLDAHPELGNNVLLARQLGLTPTGGFARHEGIEIGVSGDDELPTAELARRAREFARSYGGDVRLSPAEDGRITRRWAVCTGAGVGSDTLREAAERGVDTLVTGEGPHHTAIDADELGITVIYAGHYATETLGVQALGRHLEGEFGVPWIFIDVPTGL